jgi:hypothetical protein
MTAQAQSPETSLAGLERVEPREVGMDAERLARIDKHFARYID